MRLCWVWKGKPSGFGSKCLQSAGAHAFGAMNIQLEQLITALDRRPQGV
jgi:hypothetical protein